jgi:hypothetical protein
LFTFSLWRVRNTILDDFMYFIDLQKGREVQIAGFA